MLIDYTAKPQEFEGQLYDQRHGGPFDRGACDSYYGRDYWPHYFVGDTHRSRRVDMEQMTDNYAGYRDKEANGDKKEW